MRWEDNVGAEDDKRFEKGKSEFAEVRIHFQANNLWSDISHLLFSRIYLLEFVENTF